MNSFRRHHFMVLVLILLFITVFASNAAAVKNMDDFNKAYNQQQTQNTQNYDNNLFWNFVKLVIILGLLIGAAWSIIRLFGRQAHARMQGNWLHLVDEVMMGQNRGLVLCEIAGKIYALGVTDHNINLLFELDDPQLVQEISQTNLDELIQNKDAYRDMADRLKGWFNLNKHVSLPGKDFHILMEEQSHKLRNISHSDILSKEVNEKRSDLDE